MPKQRKGQQKSKRNGALFDLWSVVHFFTGVGLGWLMDPFIALVIMVLWEPLEIFILSPLLGRIGISFGYESINNSLSDIFFDVLGVVVGAWVVAAVIDPPFQLL